MRAPNWTVKTCRIAIHIMRCRQSVVKYALKFGVARPGRKYNRGKSYIYFRFKCFDDSKLKFYQFHRFYSFGGLRSQRAVYRGRSKSVPMRRSTGLANGIFIFLLDPRRLTNLLFHGGNVKI